MFQSNPATISAMAAIFGSLTGVLTSTLTTWITQKHEDERDLLAKRIFHREQLYSDFLGETARAMVDAMEHNYDPNKLVPAYALLSRIRLSSSTDVLDCAQQVIEHIVRTYSERNLTPEEIRSGSGEHVAPLRDFSNICRRDLESMWGAL